MRNPPNNEFVEIEPGFFIQRQRYLDLLAIGILPWEIGPYLRKEALVRASVSNVGKPLSFQEKIKEENI